MDAPTIIAAAGGLAGGSVSVGWIAKLLISRFLKENDEKHKRTAQILDKIISEIRDLDTSIRVLSAKLPEAEGMRGDIRQNAKDIAVQTEKIQRNSEDISRGFTSMRNSLKELKE